MHAICTMLEFPGKIGRITLTMRSSGIFDNCHLYGILDLGYVPREHALDVAGQLLEGGLSILQLRAKNIAQDLIFDLATKLTPLCRQHDCLFIVNDYPEIAKASGADGVHIGQDTSDLASVKRFLGNGKIVGRSTHSPEQALKGWKEGADYIGFGPLFATATKPGRTAIGLGDIRTVRKSLPAGFPMFCIGGINGVTLPAVLEAGAERVVIVSWLLRQPDIRTTVRNLIEHLA